jgi:hypothetical protein
MFYVFSFHYISKVDEQNSNYSQSFIYKLCKQP